ncbi:MAG: LysR substrate-binding domain-containing protein [Paracoccaceae bacterium]|nr:LysR substrate-binding domain-containing protein [Paracoccaceae bacterium]
MRPNAGALYASEEYLREHPPLRRLDDLRQHEIVRGGDRLALRSDSMLAQIAAVRAGVGIGWVSYFMVEAGDGLRNIPLEIPDMRVGLWMVVHADLRATARVRAFADFARDHLAAGRERFEQAS